jgi:transporter family protein
MWWIYAFLSALFAAATAILVKKGVSTISPNLATGIRTIVILIMIWGIVLFRGEARGFSGMSRQHLLFLVLSGMATGLSWMCYLKAMQLGAASKVAGVDKLSLVFTVGFAALFLGESITIKTGIGICLIVSGMVLMIMK